MKIDPSSCLYFDLNSFSPSPSPIDLLYFSFVLFYFRDNIFPLLIDKLD